MAIKPVTVSLARLAVLLQEASQRMRTRSILIIRTGHIAARAITALVSLKTSVRVRALAGRRTRGCDEEWRISEVWDLFGDGSNERISSLLFLL